MCYAYDDMAGFSIYNTRGVTVMDYVNKFNHLSQFAGTHVDTNEKKREEQRRWRPYRAAQKHKVAMQESSPRQREAKDDHEHAWKPKEDRRRW